MAVEAILSARLEVPFWCSFRVPYTVNVHFTYPVPPVTTIYGLVASALGYPADHMQPMKDLRFGIAVEQDGDPVETYSRIIKWDRRFQGMRTLVIKQKIYQPVYRVYLGGAVAELDRIASALADPAFPLFLGESDDLVEVRDVMVHDAMAVESDTFHCCVPVDCGRTVSSGITVVHLPVGFKAGSRGWDGVEYRDYYVAPVVRLDVPADAWEVDGKRVVIR
jgi:CRISPR-associated Cas5-like protein